MSAVAERPLQAQDEQTLHKMLGNRAALSPEVRNAYFRVQRIRHRVAGGGLDMGSLLLVLHLAGVVPDVFAEPDMPSDEDGPVEQEMD